MLLIYNQTSLPYANVECTYLQHVLIIPWVNTIVMRDPCYFPSSWFGSNNNIKKNHWCQIIPLEHTTQMDLLHPEFVLTKLVQGASHAWKIKFQLTNCNHCQP